MALPPLGVDVPVGIVDLEARLLSPGRLALHFEGQAEPAGTSYRAWIVRASGARYLLKVISGGAGVYDLEFELPRWCRGSCWRLALEMLDGQDRVIDSELVTPSR